MSVWESAGMSDEWYTPEYVFDKLGSRFDTDVASPEDRKYCCVPADNFITKNSLDLEWNGFCWCNPPFGTRNSINNWLVKMSEHKNGLVLTPDRSSASWWQRAARNCNSLLQVDGKIKFIDHNGKEGKSPSTGTTIFAYGEKASYSLLRADRARLGIMLQTP